VSILGLGLNSVRKVPVDKQGRMIPAKLEEMIEKCKEVGEIPLFLCCTGGTTVFGAYDPIEPCYEICKKNNMWLHVDVSELNSIKYVLQKHKLRMKN